MGELLVVDHLPTAAVEVVGHDGAGDAHVVGETARGSIHGAALQRFHPDLVLGHARHGGNVEYDL